MKKYPELSYKHVKKYCVIDNFTFQTTEEVDPLKGIIGQKKGEVAMTFGLEIDHPSYNIYIGGNKGTGRTTYTREIVGKVAKSKPQPDDWCYVHSFESKGKAVALNLPAGRGEAFQKDIDELIEDLLIQVPQAFNSEDYDQRKNEIIRDYQDQKNKLLLHLTEFAENKGFSIKSTSTGFAFVPIKDGEEISDEALKQFDKEETKKLEEQLQEIQKTAIDILVKLKNLERIAKKKLLQLEMKVGLFVVKPLIHELVEKYRQCQKIVDHFYKVEKDLVENIREFVKEEEEEEVVIADKKEVEAFVKKYKVNLLVNNSKTEGAPVVIEFNPTVNKLIGKVEYENISGVLKTDFLHIKPGAIHLANGGYLILEAKQLLNHPYAWETLKRILHTKEITIESMGNQLVDVTSLKLEPIPIDLKIVLIGSEELYHLLYRYDEDFQKYFKVFVDFDSEMQRTPEHEKEMAAFVSSYVRCADIKHFDASGVARLIEYSSRLTGNQNKLTTRFNKIIEVIIEANQWAKLDNSLLVTDKHVDKAIHEKWHRLSKYQNKVEEMFEAEKILIDIEGKKIGVINGLSVISLGEYTFGKPSVITATTAVGKEGIINIEREVNLSGDIYDKGVMILTGFLMQNFAQDTGLSISSRICFEQSYGGVDGDSASSGELYALLSSLAGIPIKQHIAVTGSINQRGYIQPVGGVTEKVEGFYRLCKKRGLTKTQGVIIPYQNIENLMLSDEVVVAIKKGDFHIYAIKHINEGIEIMTDETYEKVYEGVRKKLKYFNQVIAMD
ncbi:Lon protease family protein [Clostridium formicaceticum]|uniref:endopeptidase La n=1 Tax=Clostridium formicaceticum TaxID=1497 RepID=A0AAC9RJ58_9CLOT|nr:ATP-binding protein [Clostridium formicaceticum]AOY76332.1 ATP-dependent protease [Clostridium formicaceticum]ARE86722.1 Lon protease [Clostridium formicaceticum]